VPDDQTEGQGKIAAAFGDTSQAMGVAAGGIACPARTRNSSASGAERTATPTSVYRCRPVMRRRLVTRVRLPGLSAINGWI
jgi:hypothetical protein